MTFDFSPKNLLAVNHLRFTSVWVGFGIAMVVIVILASLVSIPQPIKAIMLQDKILHMVTYACLMGWFAQIFRHDLTRLALVIALIFLGISIEFIQGMVPARQFEVLDMVANISGVTLAWALAYTAFGKILETIDSWLCRSVLKLKA